jgi:hypothetical protein
VLSNLFYGENCWTKLDKIDFCPISHMGNSPSKHRIFGKKFTQYKKWENLGKFGLFLVYRVYLNEKNKKIARKILWSWSGECSKWHMFLVENRSFLNIFTFHLEKHNRKTWNFAQLKLMYVFLRQNYKTLKIWIFVLGRTRPCF